MAAFEDTFTVGSNENLDLHTPDVGTAWTLQSGNSGDAVVAASDDTLKPKNTNKALFTSDDLGSADCYVEFEMGNITTQVNNSFVALRIQDADNFIGMRLAGTGASGFRLCKVIAGVITDLINIHGVMGNVYRIEAVGTTIKLFEDTIQQGSDQTVSDFSTETKQGVRVLNSTNFAWADNYKADTLGAPPSTVIPVIMNQLRNQGIS